MKRSPERILWDSKAALGLLLVLAGIMAAPSAHADAEMEISDLAIRSDTLLVQFQLNDVFFEKLIDTLDRGFSATIKFTIEVWEPRRGWFDRLALTALTAYKIRYDSWSEEYLALGPEGEMDTKPSPRELSICNQGRNRMPVVHVSQLDEDKTYYVHLNVQLQPLTVEEVREIEGWLRGTWSGRDSEDSRARGVSRGLFGLVKNLVGFGDEDVSARSDTFSLNDLR